MTRVLLLTLAICSVASSQDLTPKVLPAGTTFRSDTAVFIFTRVQVESVAVKLRRGETWREEAEARYRLSLILQNSMQLKDTLLTLADRRAQLWKQNFDDQAEISKLKTPPWWDHFWVGTVGTIVIVYTSVRILEATRP